MLFHSNIKTYKKWLKNIDLRSGIFKDISSNLSQFIKIYQKRHKRSCHRCNPNSRENSKRTLKFSSNVPAIISANGVAPRGDESFPSPETG